MPHWGGLGNYGGYGWGGSAHTGFHNSDGYDGCGCRGRGKGPIYHPGAGGGGNTGAIYHPGAAGGGNVGGIYGRGNVVIIINNNNCGNLDRQVRRISSPWDEDEEEEEDESDDEEDEDEDDKRSAIGRSRCFEHASMQLQTARLRQSWK